jgi:tetratricopeptide (TPR) repeat protein
MFRSTIRIIGLLVLVCLLAPPLARADIVTLKDGRWLEGQVEEKGDFIHVHLKNGTIKIPGLKIKSILKDTDGKLSRKQAKERMKIEATIQEMRERSKWKDHYILETKHFEVHHNVTPEIAQEYIDMLEGFYKEFCKQLKVRLGPGEKRKKMQINLLRDQADYVQVGGVPGTAGYWNFVEERLFFYHDRNDPEFTLSVLLHEFTHLLAHLMKPKFCHPIWCNEGIAEYYGASKQEGSKLIYGGMQEGRLGLMKQWREDGNDYTIEELMRVPSRSFGGLEYGWAWSLVHFFIHHPKYSKKFMAYYVGLAKKSGIKREMAGYFYPTVRASEDIEHFKKTMGINNFDKLNEEWHDYIDNNLRVSSGAGYLYEAKLKYRKDDNRDALKAIEKAEEKWEGEPSPLLYYYKGLILKDLRKWDQAQTAFLKAIDYDPLNAWNYYYVGEMLEKSKEDAALDEAMRNKRLAYELAPDDWNLRFKVEQDEQEYSVKKKRKEAAKEKGDEG